MNKIAGHELSLLNKSLKQGCYRGKKKCRKPIASVQRQFKRQNIKIEKFYKSREKKCQFRYDMNGELVLYKGLGNWFPATYEPGTVLILNLIEIKFHTNSLFI